MVTVITVFVAVLLLGWTHANFAEFDFAISLLNKLPANESCIISPLSISLAISLVHSGTKRTARREIEQVILNGTANEEFSQHFSNLMQNMNEISEVKLELANRIYIREDFSLLDSYVSSVRENYNSSAISLDFNDASGSAEVVNSFVNKTTHGKITEVVTPKMFTDSTMILVNALYMKGEWSDKFRTYLTSSHRFYINPTREKKVEYLTQYSAHHDYYENDHYQLLSLKYRDYRYRFNVFLSKNKFELEKLQTNLNGADIEAIMNGRLSSQLLNIWLPKFELETNLDISKTLKDLGIKGIFDGGEDLAGFSGSDQLKVSNVMHKATIEVTEEGTIAAAATSFMMMTGFSRFDSNEHKPIDFYANHPFMFCITFDIHPVFIGKYY